MWVNQERRYKISIHASAKEATCCQHLVHILFCHFNPRLREGGDFAGIGGFRRGMISIHASAKEATCSLLKRRKKNVHFNPRLREGGDRLLSKRFCGFKGFQSTPPRRRRRKKLKLLPAATTFQSTPPRRRRPGEDYLQMLLDTISIHASAKEATFH